MKRGDVFWLDLPEQHGHEQHGRRPAVVVLSNNLVSNTQVVVVIPFTSRLKYRNLPSCVFVPRGEGGLEKDSVALVHQLRAVDKGRFGEQLGSLGESYLRELNDVLRDVLALT